MSNVNLYACRDAMWLDQQGGHYIRHIDHMTREELHSKSDIAAELGWRDYQIAELTRQVSALQLSHDNIINSLGIKGDGPVSKLVIEYVMGLVAENLALKECCKAYDADGLAEYGDQWEVTPLEIPSTEAAIAEIKAQGRVEGVIFTANRMLAAWESGFIDDTPAMALDISGAVLCALEFLPNAGEGEFKRDYADEVRSRIAANLRAGRKV